MTPAESEAVKSFFQAQLNQNQLGQGSIYVQGMGSNPVLGGNSYTAQTLTQLKNSSDKNVFMRHGEIKA